MDAIECGIVKLPRVPVSDNIPGNEMPMFRNLWGHIGKDMPKKGRGERATAAGVARALLRRFLAEDAPTVGRLVRPGAFDHSNDRHSVEGVGLACYVRTGRSRDAFEKQWLIVHVRVRSIDPPQPSGGSAMCHFPAA